MCTSIKLAPIEDNIARLSLFSSYLSFHLLFASTRVAIYLSFFIRSSDGSSWRLGGSLVFLSPGVHRKCGCLFCAWPRWWLAGLTSRRGLLVRRRGIELAGPTIFVIVTVPHREFCRQELSFVMLCFLFL